MGISQDSDAIAIVVSEETGRISVAIKGQFHLRLSAEQLESILTRELDFWCMTSWLVPFRHPCHDVMIHLTTAVISIQQTVVLCWLYFRFCFLGHSGLLMERQQYYNRKQEDGRIHRYAYITFRTYLVCWFCFVLFYSFYLVDADSFLRVLHWNWFHSHIFFMFFLFLSWWQIVFVFNNMYYKKYKILFI